LRADRVALVTVLFIVIPTAWLAVLFFAASMCRVATLSDDRHAAEVAEWTAMSYLADRGEASAKRPAEQLPFERRRAAHRRGR
jgi:hypothetical protein